MAAFSDQEEKFLNTSFNKTEIVELKKQLKEKDKQLKEKDEEITLLKAPSTPSIAHNSASGGESKNSSQETDILVSHEEKELIRRALKKMRNFHTFFGKMDADLILENCQITDAGAIKLAEMLPSSKLTGLGLGDNQITDAGKKVLSKRKWLGLSSKIKNKDGQKIGICI